MSGVVILLPSNAHLSVPELLMGVGAGLVVSALICWWAFR